MPPRKKKIEAEEVKIEQSDAILRGEQAKELLENEYFLGLIERMDETYKSEILSLHPNKPERFVSIQERRQGLHDLRGSIIGDAELGRKALAQAQGQNAKNGRVA